jgi:hypothetical protein
MTTLLVFLLVIGTIYSGEALYFEDGYDHHYTYSSESDILGLHNITTIIKVCFYVQIVDVYVYIDKQAVLED